MEPDMENFPSAAEADGAVQAPSRCRQDVNNDEIGCVLDKFYGEISDECIAGLMAHSNANGLKRVFADGELMRTALSFIDNGLNISKAARALYMHRNTMMYRLDKVKRLTGLNIKHFDDALAFKILYKAFCRSGEVE